MKNLPQQNKCSQCVMAQFCLPLGLSPQEFIAIDQLVTEKVHLAKGEAIYHQGDTSQSIFSIRHGSFKTEISLADGRGQILGFHLPGEFLGLDGVGSKQYQTQAVALEPSEVCVMKFSQFEKFALDIPSLQTHIYHILNHEITNDQKPLLTLGSLSAEEKMACFFVNLSERRSQRGLNPTEFDLSMGREEIGSFLGIQIETVSRVLSKLSEARLIQIKQKHLKLLDLEALHKIAG